MKTFFYPLWDEDPLNQFLKETYPDNMPKRIRVTGALESGAIMEDQVPAQIDRKLFHPNNPFKLSDRNLMGVLFTDDPDFATKLKNWWFGEGNLAYARSQLPWHVESLRNEGFTEEEIRDCSFSTSYPKSLRWDGSVIERG